MLNTNTNTREFKFDSIHYTKALFELMKPRVMSLAIFTCVVGFLIAPFKSIDYLNAVFEVTTEFSAERLLAYLHEIEGKFGRIRTVKNASRIIDLDLIAYHNKATRQKGHGGLCLPHPRLNERTFVLLPLFDLAPNWIHPVNGKHILELIKELPKNQRCERA